MKLFGRLLALVTPFLLLGAAVGAEDAKEGKPVSLLLVTLDTTRADHIGCYGAKSASTPILDALAREGTRFDQAISPAPLTLPSHATLFTGMTPRRHGVRNNALFRLRSDPQVLAQALRSRGYRTAAFVSSVVLDRLTGLDRGFDHYDDTVRVGSRDAFNHEERAAVQTNDAVFDYLDGTEEPFFLWVHYFDPHLPYVPPEPYRSRFPDRPYDGEIAFMDEQLGLLLREVKKKADRLLVVVAGDHGESLGDHGEVAHGIFIYEATQRVPLIVAGPGVPRGKVIGERVGLVDVAPTVLDLLGSSPLDDPDGRSVAPLLRDGKAGSRTYELESLFPMYAYGWSPLRGLVREDYKYILAPREELYRLGDDTGEMKNLITADPERAGTLARMLDALVADDTAQPVDGDPVLAEQRRKLEALGYLGGGRGADQDQQIDPKDGVAWIADLEQGRRAYQMGKPEEGIEPLQRLLSRNPSNVPALLALAMCHLGLGQPDRAVEADRRAVEIRPDDDLVHFNLANALAALAKTNPEARAEAGRHYERALQLNPRFADAYLNYAAYLEADGGEARALSLLQRARLAGVHDPGVETRLAVLELKRGNVEAAKAAFRRALELHPGDAGPLEAMARISERQGRFTEAAGYYERLLLVAPSAHVASTLGLIRLERIGDRAGALQAFERALALTPPGASGREALERRIEELASGD